MNVNMDPARRAEHGPHRVRLKVPIASPLLHPSRWSTRTNITAVSHGENRGGTQIEFRT